MKIICSKSNLLKSVSISLKAVPSKTTMPILECILIDATTNQIKFTTNDMELGIETIVEGTIEEKGMVALNAKIFYEIIRRLPDNDVTIKTDEKFAATITCEKAKFNIPGKSGEDFAYLPMIERDEPLTISQYTLKNMIYQTIFSIAVNDNNKLMTGELFEIKDNCLKIVSLDGHRIAIRKIELKNSYLDRKVVVPGKTLNEISKILSGEMDDQIDIYFSENHIMFKFDDTTVVSRLIDGEYFRIDQMLSSDYETKVTINKKEFLSCIDRATLLVKEGDKKPIIIDIQDGHIEGAAAQVIDHDLLSVLLVHAIGQGRGGGLVDDTLHVQTGDPAGVLGGLTLGVGEVGGDGDDRLGDRLTEIRLGIGLQFLQDEGAQLLRRVAFSVDGHAGLTAHQPLDAGHGAGSVRHGLALGGLAHQPFSHLGERDDRGRRALPLGVGDDDGLAALDHRHTAVGSPQVNSDYFCHGGACPFKKDTFES